MDVNERSLFWEREFEDVETVVVGNGELTDSPESQKLLKSGARVICCDGALQKLLSINIIPDAVVGDGDSMDKALLEKYHIPYFPDKSEEYNDLQKALRYCLSNLLDNIVLLGFGGLREDHFIANLSIWVMYSVRFHKIIMLTEHGIFNVMRGKAEFRSYEGMQVSVFARDNTVEYSFSGLKYPVEERAFGWLWEGSLNEATGPSFQISSNNESPVIVYRAKSR